MGKAPKIEFQCELNIVLNHDKISDSDNKSLI
jgi:hypothetical protein